MGIYQISSKEKDKEVKGEHECFHCGRRSVIWDSDSMEGDWIVHVLHCENCGAQIEYTVPFDDRKF